ncbi:MAG: ankyrin repeat domain-containing protein [bacterium]|nr:ankyrin repeat domain-containing protein [bacterium]
MAGRTAAEQSALDRKLVAAIGAYSLEGLQEALRLGANPNTLSGDKNASPIGRFIGGTWHGRTDCIEALLAAGADVNIGDSDGNTPLHRIAGSTIGGDDKVAKILLAAKPRLDIKNNAGQTALHVAARGWLSSNSPGIMLQMLETGADFMAPNALGKTPLDIATDGRKTAAEKTSVTEMFNKYAGTHEKQRQAKAANTQEKLRDDRKKRPGLNLPK